MTCGQLHLGGCYHEEFGHDGPCKVRPDETPEEILERAEKTRIRNQLARKRKKDKQRAEVIRQANNHLRRLNLTTIQES